MKALINTLYKVSSQICRPNVYRTLSREHTLSLVPKASLFHTSSCRRDLKEFFDDEQNWSKQIIRVGRAWRTDELRLKSNTDLHKLWSVPMTYKSALFAPEYEQWRSIGKLAHLHTVPLTQCKKARYVLLKEKNMLLTMEHECKEKYALFPNPERIDKVEISMNNIETVIKERNKAYHELETGETSERPATVVFNQLGLPYLYRKSEHIIPRIINTKWKKEHKFYFGGHAVSKFLKRYKAKNMNMGKKRNSRYKNHVMGLIKRFGPTLDKKHLEELYPTVDIDKAMQNKKSLGHWEN